MLLLVFAGEAEEVVGQVGAGVGIRISPNWRSKLARFWPSAAWSSLAWMGLMMTRAVSAPRGVRGKTWAKSSTISAGVKLMKATLA
jgi:hypothetical protein